MSPTTDIRPEHLRGGAWPWPVASLATPTGRIAVTDVGQGPTVLLVHAGMTSLVWRDVIALLSTDHRCVTLDAPGNGLTGASSGGPPGLAGAARAVGDVIDGLGLNDLTLVFHDLGGPAALAAAGERVDRVDALVAVNTFGWAPDSALLRIGLAAMGSAPMRALDGASRWLPRATATGLGAGRRWDPATRAAFLRLMDADASRATHDYFRDGLRTDVPAAADRALDALADRPLTTVFGARNDYFGFQRRWRDRFPRARQEVVPRGNHFPMCDAPEDVARWIREARHAEG
ncbi:alpha/beta fold hydrolase [Demequina sp. SYSU T00192]|uniref:Alpha/beta fold hydrolase n=1 Tax=Demequina litoralis TaxID=3051660 RepID=A0ABT8GC50_9MICO|nr:alpha/beta fold hydrolase [Demequina sp. SYSU T00192]MDN4476710.1 alpha/beta fold hydrolase [Demequina sp. SYSU T00192]